MTPEELHMPWRTFDLGLDWIAVLHGPYGLMRLAAFVEVVGKREVDRHELLDVCAATELGRLDAALLARAYAAARRGRGRPIAWRDLLAGATGYRREDARGELSIGAVLGRMGLVLVDVVVPGLGDPRTAKAA